MKSMRSPALRNSTALGSTRRKFSPIKNVRHSVKFVQKYHQEADDEVVLNKHDDSQIMQENYHEYLQKIEEQRKMKIQLKNYYKQKTLEDLINGPQ